MSEHARAKKYLTKCHVVAFLIAALRKFPGLRPHGAQAGSSRTALCILWCPDGSSRTALIVLGPCSTASPSHPIRKKSGVPFILSSFPGTRHTRTCIVRTARIPQSLSDTNPPFCTSEVLSRLPPPRACPSRQQRSTSHSPNIPRPGHRRCWSRRSLREVNWFFFCAGFKFGQGGGHCSRGSARDGLVGKPLPFCRRYRVIRALGKDRKRDTRATGIQVGAGGPLRGLPQRCGCSAVARGGSAVWSLWCALLLFWKVASPALRNLA